MLYWKRLLVMKELKNESLPKIFPAAFGKMEPKNTVIH